jgi:plastocyanin
VEEQLPDRKTLTWTLVAASLLIAPAGALAAGPQDPVTQTSTSTTSTPAPPAPVATTPAPTNAPASAPAPSTTTTTTSTVTTPAATAESAAKTTSQSARKAAAHIASTVSVSIVDYAFNAATVHIKVGQTVTWTNTGKQPHTATANDGSFDTPVLNNGQSASHTFNTAGTFAYICKIHPNMKGTIVVAATSSSSGSGSGSGSGGSGSSSGSTSGSSGSAATSTPTATTASSSGSSAATLPLTGMDLIATIVIGAAMLGGGVAIRRRISAR